MIVQSFGALQALSPSAPSWQMSGSSAGSLDLYGASLHSYAHIYRTQPNVRTCVDFLARNVAQLGLPVFRRVSDTDRVRLPDHELATWLEKPNPATTRYRLIDALVRDYLVYDTAYWLKVRSTPMSLIRIPPAQMAIEGTVQPTLFWWTFPNGQRTPFPPSEIVHFGGYSPDHGLRSVSVLETLRRILAEEAAAGVHREQLWQNAGRQEGVWEITTDSPAAKWSTTQSQDWREQWQQFAGGGSKAGMTAIGPAGGSYKPISYSAKDAEYLGTRKLTREECASAWHIPLPMVGILDHATYSNVAEMRKMLYADCLGPTLEMIQAEIERQMLPDCDDTDRVYVEFNIAEKLKGSFTEQAASLALAVGRPWMTANEARALQNLPADDDPSSSEIAAQQGGPAAPAEAPDPDDPPVPFTPPKPGADASALTLEPVIQAHQARQAARLNKLPAEERPAAFAADLDRWNRELSADLAGVTGTVNEDFIAASVNGDTLSRLELEALDV